MKHSYASDVAAGCSKLRDGLPPNILAAVMDTGRRLMGKLHGRKRPRRFLSLATDLDKLKVHKSITIGDHSNQRVIVVFVACIAFGAQSKAT